ncbi:Heat shock protein HslJ [Blastococcus aurantiacus]|uniref:Heat shock protein HslJ n=1 Tax=Blastococcus aurantiacus TaxID=1550231 RepID=A0A1G7PRG2_9ACTN|nr:META domain-containing protein [Blastococcus aurantiacus]SDF88887.1 Heat shock protein HslJ [Blastococcus aurantiacus]
MRRLVLLLLGVLAIAACGTEADAGGGTADVEGEWHLTGGTADGADLPAPPGAQATLELAGDDARGTAFCNSWFATARLDGSALTFDGIGQTEMGCPPEVMAAESAYLAALGGVRTSAVRGDELVLSGDAVELRFSRVAPLPDSPLAGTRWVLDTLVDGATASSTLGEPAVLELGQDGALTASTGCRSIGGSWRSEGESLVVDAPYDAFGCPPPADRQDVHVLGVLAARPVATIDADRLTLTADDGRGLVYRAAS